MSIWDELGIEQTDNVRKIKKAYAVRAKLVHPEEHPEEFRQLHGAYTAALRLAENKGRKACVNSDNNNPETISDYHSDSDYDFQKAILDSDVKKHQNAAHITEMVMKKLETFYNSDSYVRIHDYMSLFNSREVQEAAQFDVFIDSLYEFLKTHFISDSLAYSVYLSLCCNYDYDDELSEFKYDKIIGLVIDRYYSYMLAKEHALKNKKYSIISAVIGGAAILLCAVYAFYMAYKSGQLGDFINSLKGYIRI